MRVTFFLCRYDFQYFTNFTNGITNKILRIWKVKIGK
jgi:hypothetical protein